MSDTPGSETSAWKREAIVWLLPVFMGLVGVLGGFIYSNAQDDRFEQRVVLVSANDGRISVRDNRDLAFEEAQAILAERERVEEDIDISFDSRFNASLDIFVEADTQAGAEVAAESLATAVVQSLTERSRERFVDAIAADAASAVELEVEIASIDDDIAATPVSDTATLTRLERERAATVDSKLEIKRRLVGAHTNLISATAPVRISQSVSRGQSAPKRREAAGLAGATAAVATLLLVALFPRREI